MQQVAAILKDKLNAGDSVVAVIASKRSLLQLSISFQKLPSGSNSTYLSLLYPYEPFSGRLSPSSSRIILYSRKITRIEYQTMNTRSQGYSEGVYIRVLQIFHICYAICIRENIYDFYAC